MEEGSLAYEGSSIDAWGVRLAGVAVILKDIPLKDLILVMDLLEK